MWYHSSFWLFMWSWHPSGKYPYIHIRLFIDFNFRHLSPPLNASTEMSIAHAEHELVFRSRVRHTERNAQTQDSNPRVLLSHNWSRYVWHIFKLWDLLLFWIKVVKQRSVKYSSINMEMLQCRTRNAFPWKKAYLFAVLQYVSGSPIIFTCMLYFF